MMKILITYSSRTGNTKKVAEAIHEEFKDCSELIPIESVQTTSGYDYVFIGFWADRGTADEKAAKFMATVEDQKCGIFATMGAYPYSVHAHEILVNASKLLSEKNKVMGAFICQGAVDPALLERFKSFPKDNPHYPTEATQLRHKIAAEHPDENDLKTAREIFRNIVERDI